PAFEAVSQPARQRPCMLALVSTADLPRAGSLDSACREPETRPLAWVAFLPSRSTPDPETLQHFEAQHVEQEHHQPKQYYLHRFQPRRGQLLETSQGILIPQLAGFHATGRQLHTRWSLQTHCHTTPLPWMWSRRHQERQCFQTNWSRTWTRPRQQQVPTLSVVPAPVRLDERALSRYLIA